MKHSTFAPPCFSSQCGFCASCNRRGDIPRSQPRLDRIRQLAKFTKSENAESVEVYRNQMNRMIQKEQMGISLLETHTEEGLYDTATYTRIPSPHQEICDNPPCMRVYCESPDYFHGSWFPQIPMYRRESSVFRGTRIFEDTKIHLCGICVNLGSSPKSAGVFIA
jgi:hypothetical protein